MKSFYLKIILTAGWLILGSAIFAVAQEGPFSKLTYPIPELGNCQSREACEAYCDQSENMETCLDFAEVHALVPEEEIVMGRKMLALGLTDGPGGCEGQQECEAYCDEITHIRECIEFAEEHGLIPDDELEEARKVADAIDRGLTPPTCRGKRECDVYCSKPEHMEECIAFGEAAGLIPPDEMADAKKMLEAIRRGVKPPACQGKAECDIYCSQAEHMEECMTFAIAAGFMPPEDIENAKKTLEAIKQGVKPPNCQGKEECDVYCSQLEHMEECMTFAIAAGFMSPEEIEGAQGTLRAIKQGIKPPTCRGEEECNAYCSQVEHMEECMEFSIAAGFMPPEELENAQRMLEAIKKGAIPPNCQGEEECSIYCSQPEHQMECINFSEAAGFMNPEDAAKARKMAELGIVGGPGGCQGEEECGAFCKDPANMETCINYSVMIGDMTQEEAEEALEGMRMMQEGGEFGPGMMSPEGFEGEIPEGHEGEFEGEIPEGMMPEEFQGQFQEQFKEQFEQQMQQQIEQQIQQFAPPPETIEAPQPFFEVIRNFLASLIPVI